MGVIIGGRNVTDIRYAHNTALIADNITGMGRKLHRVEAAGNKVGLKLYAKRLIVKMDYTLHFEKKVV